MTTYVRILASSWALNKHLITFHDLHITFNSRKRWMKIGLEPGFKSEFKSWLPHFLHLRPWTRYLMSMNLCVLISYSWKQILTPQSYWEERMKYYMESAYHIVGSEWILLLSFCKQTDGLHLIRVWGIYKSACFSFLLYCQKTQSSLRAPGSICTWASLFRCLFVFILHHSTLYLFIAYNHFKYIFEDRRFKPIMGLLTYLVISN